MINVRTDDCFWPVTVVDVAVSVPPAVVRITSVVSEVRSLVPSVGLSARGPGVTDTPLSAFLGNINGDVTRRWMGGAQITEIETMKQHFFLTIGSSTPMTKLKTYDQKSFPKFN